MKEYSEEEVNNELHEVLKVAQKLANDISAKVFYMNPYSPSHKKLYDIQTSIVDTTVHYYIMKTESSNKSVEISFIINNIKSEINNFPYNILLDHWNAFSSEIAIQLSLRNYKLLNSTETKLPKEVFDADNEQFAKEAKLYDFIKAVWC